MRGLTDEWRSGGERQQEKRSRQAEPVAHERSMVWDSPTTIAI